MCEGGESCWSPLTIRNITSGVITPPLVWKNEALFVRTEYICLCHDTSNSGMFKAAKMSHLAVSSTQDAPRYDSVTLTSGQLVLPGFQKAG